MCIDSVFDMTGGWRDAGLRVRFCNDRRQSLHALHYADGFCNDRRQSLHALHYADGFWRDAGLRVRMAMNRVENLKTL